MSLEAGAFGPLADRAIDEADQRRSVERAARADRRAARGWRRPAPKRSWPGSLVPRTSKGSSPASAWTSPASIICCRVCRSKASSRCSKRSARRRADGRGAGCSIARPDAAWTSRRSSIARLADERWYVQRNMLMLLARSRHVPATFSPRRGRQHPDARVRSEAIRLQLTLPHERDAGVLPRSTIATRASSIGLDGDSATVPAAAGRARDRPGPGLGPRRGQPSAGGERACARLRPSRVLDALPAAVGWRPIAARTAAAATQDAGARCRPSRAVA